MGTILQKNLANNIVKNLKRKKPLNKGQLVEISGYSKSTSTQQIPAVFEQKGVQEELAILGFDEQTAKEVVGKILKDETIEPKDRLKAAEQVFKVHGSYKDTEKPAEKSNTTYNFIFSKEIQADVNEIESRIKARLINNHEDSPTC